MADYVATVDGDGGSPVLLLAGGASSSHGFFPGLVEALADHRVISLDRPGTGRAQEMGEATMASGSAAAANAVRELDAGPVVVVGQSLGGALAVQLATDHPDLVAGMVLVDPTPLDATRDLRLARWIFRVMQLPGRLPLIGRRLDRALFRSMGKGFDRTPQVEEAFEVMTTSATLAVTSRAIRTMEHDLAALAPRVRRLDIPVVLMTADRPHGHAVRRSHDRLAAALGARVVAPAGAIHAQHLRDPDSVNRLVLDVVGEVDSGASSG